MRMGAASRKLHAMGHRVHWVQASLSSFILKEEIAPRLSLAGNWLLDHVFEDSGWGYNSLVGSDADSTAYSILFLNSITRQVPEAAFAHLSQYQSPAGGFSTYRSIDMPDSWTVPHPDVTAMALLALLAKPILNHNSLQTGIDYVLKEKTSDFHWWMHFGGSADILYGSKSILTECPQYLISPAGFN